MKNNKKIDITDKSKSLGLCPLDHPLGDGHHTEEPFSDGDKIAGDVLGWFMGSLFADLLGQDPRYWCNDLTSVVEWARVARALRIHGLAITNAQVGGR